MSDDSQPCYLVDPYSDPVVLRIQGKASYLNCAPVSKLFKEIINGDTKHILIDFTYCSGMDSTFLGILASAAMKLRSQTPPGTLSLTGLGTRNLELITNLGLHRIATVHAESTQVNDASTAFTEKEAPVDRKTMLEAHEKLVEADSDNLRKFQDVIAFLKKPD